MRRLVIGLIGTAAFLGCAGAAHAAPPLRPPTNLAAAVGNQRITLSWTASSSPKIGGYRVYRQTGGTWPATPLATTAKTATSYVDGGLTNGTTYTYRVTAIDASSPPRESAPSNTASATPVGQTAGPCGSAALPPLTYDHVVWIVMENHSYSEVVGSSSAPYENQLAAQCGSASRMFAESHPSLPNYIAMTSGSTQGITDDNAPSSHPLGVASIFSQTGGGWRALQESMPSNCLLSNSGQYAVRHNPAAYYTGIRTECGTLDVPLGSTPDLSARYTFVTPNLCNDTHDCPVSTGDAWLSGFVGQVLASAQYQAGRTAVFVTWDEDDSSMSNQIPTLVIAPSVIPGTASTVTFSHYSMLRSTEEMLGIGTFLGGAASATSMRSAFNL
ncbi:MAG: phosphatidylinositol-3-phosphatase [Solirubrobacteraceae bacterium]|nr:phosphatidylinositol-3-phosphatase [Solirubrobacteraceae bacterium]